jgi:hypothetical protein
MSCEKTLTFSHEESRNKLVINALAQPDSMFYLHLSGSLFYGDLRSDLYSTLDFLTIRKADVKLTVNDKDQYTMRYVTPNRFSYNRNRYETTYLSSYIPKAGDRLYIQAHTDAYSSDYEDVWTNVTIPNASKISIVQVDTFTVETGSDRYFQTRIKLRITDPLGQRNGYRLRVNSSAEHYYSYIDESSGELQEKWVSRATSTFSSSDIIFTQSENGSQPIFSDDLFDGEAYEFIIDTSIDQSAYGDVLMTRNPTVSVTLQTLTEDYYFYLRALDIKQRTNNTDDQDYYQYSVLGPTESSDESKDIFASPVYIPSNVENGFGMVGAMSSEKQTVKF